MIALQNSSMGCSSLAFMKSALLSSPEASSRSAFSLARLCFSAPDENSALSPFLFLLFCPSPSPSSSSFDLSFCSFVEIGSSLLSCEVVCPTLSFSTWGFPPPPPPHQVLSVMVVSLVVRASVCFGETWCSVSDFSVCMFLHVDGSLSVSSDICMRVIFLCLFGFLVEFWVYVPETLALRVWMEVLPEGLRRGTSDCCFLFWMPPMRSSPSSFPFPCSFWRVAAKMA